MGSFSIKKILRTLCTKHGIRLCKHKLDKNNELKSQQMDEVPDFENLFNTYEYTDD